MEKRNVIEDGRTPEDGVKMADALDKTAENIAFSSAPPIRVAAPPTTKETPDEKKDKHG